MLIAALLILAVVSSVAVLYYIQEENTTNAIATATKFFEPLEKCNKVNDCITFHIPAEPDVIRDDSTTEEEFQEQQFYENGTEIPKESYITGAVADTSFTSTGAKESKYKEIGNRMVVSKGNIAVIEGQIKLLDENQNIVEPRVYKYFLTIECSELTEFCNLNPISRRGVTQNGSFIEKWTTNFRDLEGLYVVDIYAESEQKDPYGQFYRVENQLFIELV